MPTLGLMDRHQLTMCKLFRVVVYLAHILQLTTCQKKSSLNASLQPYPGVSGKTQWFSSAGKNAQTRNASNDSLFTHCMQGTFETTEHVMCCTATVQIMIFICKKCLLLAIWLLVYTYVYVLL